MGFPDRKNVSKGMLSPGKGDAARTQKICATFASALVHTCGATLVTTSLTLEILIFGAQKLF